VALALAVLTAGAALAQAWQPYSNEAGKFSVEFPGKPRFEKRTVPSAAGPLPLNNFTVSANGGATAYIVSYTDYPAAITGNADPQKMLIGARDGQLKNLDATASSDTVIDVNGSPGRDIQFKSTKGYTGRTKLVLVKSRLYQVLALTTNGTGKPADFARFVNSFKLTN
jgi:hypothetical protein